MSNTAPNRFLSIRLTEAEYKEIYRRVERSTCRSLTEYVKKVVTGKPVIGKVRNESQDQLLQEIVHVKNKLNELAETAERTNDQSLLAWTGEIKSIILQIAKKWLQS